jgi:hypothetical protein
MLLAKPNIPKTKTTTPKDIAGMTICNAGMYIIAIPKAIIKTQ